uniref:Gelsolin-like domain-containing protein n=1 Tax=Ascaris lumbricoides TaxID=6252 RepID=A0A0M3ITB7_ASCLU
MKNFGDDESLPHNLAVVFFDIVAVITFLSCFRYLQGGSGSGFNHVIDKYENWKPRLFQCKGKRNVACERNSLNLGDVFILDCGLDLYVWMPPESGRLERIKGMSQAKSIRDQERHGKPKVHVLDQDWNRNEAFWNVMGGRANLTDLKSAAAGGADENFWRTSRQQVTLWRVCDESGKTEVSKVSQGDFKYNQLESKDAFILDAWNGGVFVWIGKGCTKQERTKAMKWAQEYLKTQQKPEWTQVVRVMEGAEPAIFTQWSSSWQDGNAAHGFQPKLFQCSDESGHLVVEEIANFTQEDLDGDDVMILDGLNTIFVWIGANANA